MNDDPSDPLRLDQPGMPDEQLQRAHAILLSKKPEHADGQLPLPLMLVALWGACILFSAIYIGRYSGDFDPMVYDERIPPGTLKGNAVAPTAKDPKVLGRHIFMASCAACHQATGLGLPGAYPPLADSEWAMGPDDRIIRIVLNGLSGPITVKGTPFNSSMPSLGPSLRDVQLAAALSYVRSAWGNNAPAVSPDKVKKIRAVVTERAGPWIPEELLKIP